MREVASLPFVIAKMFADVAAAKWAVAICAGFVEFFFPTDAIKSAAGAAFVLILLDTVTGLVAAAVTHKQISSAKFGRVLVKLLGYGSVLVVTNLVAYNVVGLGNMKDPAVMVVLTLILMTEGLSVLENVRCMGVQFPDFLEKMLRERLNIKEDPFVNKEPGDHPDEPDTHPVKPAGD